MRERERAGFGLPKLLLEHELPLSQLLPGEFLPPCTQNISVLPIVFLQTPLGIPSLQPKRSKKSAMGVQGNATPSQRTVTASATHPKPLTQTL